MLKDEQNPEVCDATDDDSSNTVWYIIIETIKREAGVIPALSP
jgi:hypothetical protein